MNSFIVLRSTRYPFILDLETLAGMSTANLQALLKVKGLRSSGSRKDCIDRLRSHLPIGQQGRDELDVLMDSVAQNDGVPTPRMSIDIPLPEKLSATRTSPRDNGSLEAKGSSTLQGEHSAQSPSRTGRKDQSSVSTGRSLDGAEGGGSAPPSMPNGFNGRCRCNSVNLLHKVVRRCLPKRTAAPRWTRN